MCVSFLLFLQHSEPEFLKRSGLFPPERFSLCKRTDFSQGAEQNSAQSRVVFPAVRGFRPWTGDAIPFGKFNIPLSTFRPLSWYNEKSSSGKGALSMPEQELKTPCCVGLLAHVSASRGEPHNYNYIPGPKTGDVLRTGNILIWNGFKRSLLSIILFGHNSAEFFNAFALSLKS